MSHLAEEKIKNCYKTMLKALDDAKGALGEALAEDLTFGGGHVQHYLDEMKYVSYAIGLAMGLMKRNGEKTEPIESQPGFVKMQIDSRIYMCNEAHMDLPELQEKKEKPVVEEEKTIVRETVKESIPEEKSGENTPKEETSFTPAEESAIETEEEGKTEIQSSPTYEDPFEEKSEKVSPSEQDETGHTRLLGNMIDEPVDVAIQESDDIFLPEYYATGTEETPKEESAALVFGGVEEKPEKKPSLFEMKGDNEPTVSSMNLADMYMEEKKKPFDQFVFETYRVNISHQGMGRPEEIYFMIAPLKISRFEQSNAPIIAYAYYKGRTYTANSNENKEDGRNTIVLQLGDYEVLCRGSFNEDGKFMSMIVTTGISARQGDQIHVLSKESHCPTGRNINNGHLKFRYNSDDGIGTIEIFPVGVNDEDFVVLATHGEWIDTFNISKRPGGLPNVSLRDNGLQSCVVCTRNGDDIEADIVPM